MWPWNLLEQQVFPLFSLAAVFAHELNFDWANLIFAAHYCVWGTRTQPRISVGCPVQLISEVFWDYICVDTHLPRFEALVYVLPPFDSLTHAVISVSSAGYIFQQSAEGLLWICVCWIFQSVHLSKVPAAVGSQSKSTELCSSAAVVPQSKSTEMWSSAAPFHHNLWYFWHRTNDHFRSMLFIRKNL